MPTGETAASSLPVATVLDEDDTLLGVVDGVVSQVPTPRLQDRVDEDALLQNFMDLMGWTDKPEGYGTAQLLSTSGRLESCVIYVRPGVIDALCCGVQAAGAGLTAGQTKMAAYMPEAGGALLGTSVDMATAFGTTGFKEAALVSTIDWPGGLIRVAVWSVWTTTAPTLYRGSSVPANNAGATPPRAASADTGLTTTAPATIGTLTAQQSDVFWFAARGTPD